MRINKLISYTFPPTNNSVGAVLQMTPSETRSTLRSWNLKAVNYSLPNNVVLNEVSSLYMKHMKATQNGSKASLQSAENTHRKPFAQSNSRFFLEHQRNKGTLLDMNLDGDWFVLDFLLNECQPFCSMIRVTFLTNDILALFACFLSVCRVLKMWGRARREKTWFGCANCDLCFQNWFNDVVTRKYSHLFRSASFWGDK